jgi:hypothetical protein
MGAARFGLDPTCVSLWGYLERVSCQPPERQGSWPDSATYTPCPRRSGHQTGPSFPILARLRSARTSVIETSGSHVEQHVCFGSLNAPDSRLARGTGVPGCCQ